MALYKDGNVIRTYEEQVDHLTKKHLEQIVINENVSADISALSVASNLGGYNLVRFAFEKSGTFYELSSWTGSVTGDEGDYYEVSSGNEEDIPAYGYFGKHGISHDYRGDFKFQYPQLTLRNVTKGLEFTVNARYLPFGGSSLMDYDPNAVKKQIFNVLDDLAYNSKTQYASFDLNRDGLYNFVYLGSTKPGRDGTNIYSTDGVSLQLIVNMISVNDSVLFASDNTTTLIDANAVTGDVYTYKGNNVWEKQGNIRGQVGATGATGATGEQGIQGVQGVQGIQGEKGDKGDKGDPGDQGILINTGVLNSPSELPPFANAVVGDAYRVINTSGTIVTYDLYFKAKGGTNWDIQPNWGGVKGDKGDKGDQGEQGVQGVQGIQGAKGEDGQSGLVGSMYIKSGMYQTSYTITDFSAIYRFTVLDPSLTHIVNIMLGSNSVVSVNNFKWIIVQLTAYANQVPGVLNASVTYENSEGAISNLTGSREGSLSNAKFMITGKVYIEKIPVSPISEL